MSRFLSYNLKILDSDHDEPKPAHARFAQLPIRLAVL